MKRIRVIKLNPAPEVCGGRKPADQVTDRALRYRANSKECRPELPRRCLWCGMSDKKNPQGLRPIIEVAHIDGNETNSKPENLAWTCRSCNQKVAVVMKRAGVGRPTNQYNPKGRKRRRGATDWRQFAEAVAITKGETIGNLDDAIALIQATSASARSDFQKDIWDRRKELYGPSGRKDGGAVPF